MPSRLDLGPADLQTVVEDLSLQIGQIDGVHVGQTDRADTGRGKIQRRGTTQTTGPDDQDT